MLTYNRILPDIKRLTNKHWDMLKINKDFEEVFKKLLIIAFRRSRSLNDIINSKSSNLCCILTQSANTFEIPVFGKVFKICNKLNSKSKYVINLMECLLCNKQYIGKPETLVNFRRNNFRKDVNKQNSLQADKQFLYRLPGHNVNRQVKFALTEQLNDTNIDKELLNTGLKSKKTSGFKLKILKPDGFNAKLNFPNP